MAELKKLGRYELRRVLGKGAMGVVYEGFDPTLGRRVAVKTILKSVALDEDTARDYSERFVREAKAVGRLNHPHIVQVHDFGEDNEAAYLVMEFIQGQDLRACFDAGEKFEPAEAVRVMGELLDALDFAHEAGVIHRDVKPANVMLDGQRRVKLADFGVARVQDSGRSAVGTMVGTPAFMSPEQIKGGRIDRRTDIFSAGLILYQLLAGEQPFKGEGAWTVATKIVNEEPPPPSRVAAAAPAPFDKVVARALAKDPARRFANAREFAAALRAAAAGDDDATVAIGAARGAQSFPSPRKAPALPVLLALAAVIGVAGAYFMLERAPAPPQAKLAVPAIDEAKIRRQTEERMRREFAEKAAAEKAAGEKAASAQAAADRAAAEKAATEKAVAENIAAARATAEKAAAEKAAAEMAAAERVAAEKSAAEKIVAAKAAAEKAATEKAAAERAAAEKAAAVKLSAATPGLPVAGDRWIYEARDAYRPEFKFEVVVQVRAATSSVVVDVTTLEGGTPMETAHAPGAHLVGSGDLLIFSPYMGTFQEIRAGQRWPDIEFGEGACASMWTCSFAARVLRKETVAVKAGSYDAWVIVLDQEIRYPASGATRQHTYWYAEKVKRIVKYQSRDRAGVPAQQRQIDMELVTYAPAGAK